VFSGESRAAVWVVKSLLILRVTRSCSGSFNTYKSMTNKNPFVVFLLVFVTFGIYAVVWYVKAGREMRRRGANVPTAWLIIIPIVSIYWFIKWCAGVGKVGAMNGFLAALLLIFLGPLGMAIVQSQFNNVK